MKLVRMLSMAGFVLLGATWVQADTVPGHFEINLNNPGQTDLGGWISNGTPSSFETTVYSTTQSGAGFQQGSFNCQSEDSEWQNGWNWWGWNSWDFSNFRDSNNGCDNDPYILVTQGQHSNGIPSSFSADGNGGNAPGTLDFFNDTGHPIDAILLTVSNFQPGMYYCDYVPGLAYEFDHCGFSTDRNGDLEILFWDNPGDSVPAVPEPTLGVLLLIALSAMVATRRIRSRRAAAV